MNALLPHRHPGPYLAGRMIARPNRFLLEVELEDGARVHAHLGDRGRLEGILFPGAEVWLARAAAPHRSTAYSVVCARCPPLGAEERGPIGALDPAGANRLVRALLEARVFPELPPYGAIRPEVRHGDSRFDFALALDDGRRLLLEVKSCVAAASRAALFPDAPSERAARHLRELAALARAGAPAAVVLVAGRADVASIRPHPVDPAFAVALDDARSAGVLVLGVAFEAGLDGLRYAGRRPVRRTAPKELRCPASGR